MEKTSFPVHGMNYLENEEDPIEVGHFILEHDILDTDILYPHRHSFYLILIINKGSGTHMLDFNTTSIEPNSLFFITPHQVHHWHAIETIEGYTVAFKPEFLACSSFSDHIIADVNLFKEFARLPKIRMVNTEDQMSALLQNMLFEYDKKESEFISILRAYLHIFLQQVKRRIDSMDPQPSVFKSPLLVRKYQDMVSENISRGWSVQEYADKLNTSVSKLHSLLKAATGKTPLQIIHDEIILEAKRLLVNSNLTVAEIGYKLQISDPSYFARYFRRETGVTPSAFRKSIVEKYQHQT